jgi:predicted DNA-binding ribbon-helix-helix protein
MIPSHIKKHSFIIHGRKTSVSLEPEFRKALDGIAASAGITTNALVSRINSARDHANLSSAIRLYVLRDTQSVLARARSKNAADERQLKSA